MTPYGIAFPCGCITNKHLNKMIQIHTFRFHGNIIFFIILLFVKTENQVNAFYRELCVVKVIYFIMN